MRVWLPTKRAHPLLIPLGAVMGLLMIQASWALVVPPFRGLDEHDHAYKAAAVAHGDWSAEHERSEDGWGEMVDVPRDLVLAAGPICESLPYTTPDNCTPGLAQGGGLVWVASSAARYNPTFYFLIGSPARAFSGSESLYVMRIAGILLCAGLIGLALLATRNWARTPWPLATMLLACTPMMLYSTTVAAPNGIEMAGALLTWSGLLGLARDRGADVSRPLVVLTTAGALPLVSVRTLGPVWLCLIVLTVSLLLTPSRVRFLMRDVIVVICAGILLVATAVAGFWSIVAGTNSPESSDAHPVGSVGFALLDSWILWFFQAIAAFPARNEMAPLALYAIALPAWWIVAMVALRMSGGRERLSLAAVVALSSLVPLTVTALTYEQLGTAWQGRYGYPFAMGFMLISGFILDRALPARPWQSWPICMAALVMFSTQLIGQLGVLRSEQMDSPLSGTEAWIQPSPVVVVALSILGSTLLAWSLTRVRSTPMGSLRG